MKNDSQIIAAAFYELQEFCRDISLLLSTGEEVFTRLGWNAQRDKAGRPAGPSRSGGSSKLNNPDGWLPLRYFRFYSHPKHAEILAYLAVIIDLPSGHETEDGSTYLTAGGLKYGKPKGWGKGPAGTTTNVFRWHLHRPDSHNDGKPSWHLKSSGWSKGTLPKNWKKVTAGIDAAVTLGVPLHEVTGAKELEDRVIRPLLAEIKSGGNRSRDQSSKRLNEQDARSGI